ncbi:MAG: DUF2452 domain-containing protein [SAR324 cluster bacterium]|nr:DUF2452 domain-containing protein [SAR324 cluster bacterium]
MSEKETKSPLIQQGETLYPTQVRTEKDRVTDLTVSQDQSLERSNDTANREIERLREQAKMLMEQADKVEFESQIRAKIRSADCGFRPVVNQPYFLYENEGKCMLSLISPNEWNGQPPFGHCLAKVVQLGDLTWEISERMASP